MTLQTSGAISFNNIQTEFGGANPISLNEYYAGGAYVPAGTSGTNGAIPASGAISMSQFYGTSKRITINVTISANTINYSLNVPALSGYVAGQTDVILTINSGVYVYSTNPANYALMISSSNASDTITVVNNGYIMGCGGDGEGNSGPSGGTPTSIPAESGGPAILINSNVTINNTNASAYIGGGGGGGGGIALTSLNSTGGGGAGGGDGGRVNSASTPAAGGGVGSVGASASGGLGGAGGGRIFPGTGGSGGVGATAATGGGAGGGGGSAAILKGNTNAGGGGGGWGATGGSYRSWGTASTTAVGGSGGAGNAAGGTATVTSGTVTATRAGAAGGKAVTLNGFTVTWTSGNTTRVYGAVS